MLKTALTLALVSTLGFSGVALAQGASVGQQDGGEAEGSVDKGGESDGADEDDSDEGAKPEGETPQERKARLKKERQEAKNKNRRDLDPDSPEAQALDELLALDPQYAKDGTVRLLYTFTEPSHQTDWELNGFDKADQTRNRRGRKRAAQRGLKTRFLSLAVGSQRKGLLRHRLEMKGEFEVTYDLLIERMTTRSDLVFVVGKAGARFGNQFVKGSRGSFRVAVRCEVDREPFESSKRVTVRLVCGSGKITSYVNGQKVGETEKLDGKLDGQIGIFATDMNLVVRQIEIKGEIDKKKL